MDDFAAVLRQADQCVLLPIMGSREVDDGSVKSEDLAARFPAALWLTGWKALPTGSSRMPAKATLWFA